MKLKYFRIAKRLSYKSDSPHFQLGSVIVHGNKILGLGFNRNKTSPKSSHPWHFIHSEIDALKNCSNKPIDATIYVFRQNKHGELAEAKPCKYCLQSLKNYGIKKICYTVANGFKEEKI